MVGNDGSSEIVKFSVSSSIVSNDEGRWEGDGGGEGVSVAPFIDERWRNDEISRLCDGVLMRRTFMLFHGGAQLL